MTNSVIVMFVILFLLWLLVNRTDVGHIAGAAMIGLSSSEGRILRCCDISVSQQRTVDGTRLPAFAPDVLIVESTYGYTYSTSHRVW